MSDAAAATTDPVRGYAVAHLRHIRDSPEIAAYLERLDATLETYGGRFLIHGGGCRVLEGDWSGSLVVIEFPTAGHAAGWYDSPAYRQILPLRQRNADGWALLANGVPAHHRATDVLPTP